MAVVRRGPTACVHAPGCPHDIGPAAAKTGSTVNAIAHAAGLLERADGSLADRARLAGSGPVERREETPAERLERHAREHPSWEAGPAAPGIPMHIPRPRQLHPVTPSQQRPEEDPVPVADQVPIPCGTCLHAPVCRLKAEFIDAGLIVAELREISPGLRVIANVTRVECDHHLAPVTAPRAIEVAEVIAGMREVTATVTDAERVQSSRAKGAEHLRKATDSQIVDAVRASGGDMEAAGRLLPITSSGARLRVKAMAAAGTLPGDVAAMLAGRARNGKPKATVAA